MHLIVFGLAFSPLVAAQVPANPKADHEWIGKRVVQKVAKLTLRINDEPIENAGEAPRIYRVEQVDGPSLLLHPESQGKSGWAGGLDVIAVDQAVDFFSQKIRLEPKNPFLFAMMALLRQDAHEYDLAIRNYDEAIRLDPRSAASFAGRATAWHAKGEFDKAVADFDLALSLDPKNPSAYLGRGLTRAARNQYTLAIADFSEAIWLDPLSISAYDNRGRAWQSKGEFAKAIIDYNMSLRLEPQQGSVYRRRGSCFESGRNFAKAIADYNEAIRFDPGDALAYGQKARLLATCPDRALRDLKLAILSATKACELTNWRETAELDTLAAVCAAAGDFGSAVKWQTKSNALSRRPLEQKEGEARLKRYLEKRP